MAAVSLSSKKVDDALRLTLETRNLLLQYGHSKNASVASLLRIQGLLRSILQCISLMQAYDQTPYRSNIYGHVSRTFMNVLDLQLEGGESFSDKCQSDEAVCHSDAAAAAPSSCPRHACGETDSSDSCFLPRPPGGNAGAVGWADVVGCEEAIAALKQATTLPLRFPQLFKGQRRPARRVLLYGPPGTGKTLLAAAAAAEYGATLLAVSSADILSKWVGESEQHVRRIFETASQLPRCVLFFDEVDSICSARGGVGESEASRRIKTELLLRMQSADAENVTIIAATNMPWELDSAFRRRFDHLIFVGLPPPTARRQLFLAELQSVPHVLTDDDFQWLVDSTEGYSASDIRQLAQHALMLPVLKISQAQYVKPLTLGTSSQSGRTRYYVPCCQDDENAVPLDSISAADVHVPEVCRSDFEAALEDFYPSVSAEEMEKFKQWRGREKHIKC